MIFYEYVCNLKKCSDIMKGFHTRSLDYMYNVHVRPTFEVVNK